MATKKEIGLSAAGTTALTIAPFTGPAAPFVAGGAALAKIASRLFSRAPRGEYQKFLREAYPLMLRQAQARNTPVACYWFGGEIVEVRPDGAYGVVASQIANVSQYEDWLRGFGEKARIYGLFCADTLVNCKFRFYGSGAPETLLIPGRASTQAGFFTTGNMLLMVIAGAVTWVILGGK